MKAANDNLNDDLTGRTQDVWQPRLGCDLSSDEAKQISANMTGFFSILAEWSRADMPAPANDNDPAAASDQEARDDR